MADEEDPGPVFPQGKEAIKRSQEIDQMLKQAAKEEARHAKLLLLGTLYFCRCNVVDLKASVCR